MATRGDCWFGSLDDELAQLREMASRRAARIAEALDHAHEPAVTADGVEISLQGNIELAREVNRIAGSRRRRRWPFPHGIPVSHLNACPDGRRAPPAVPQGPE